ncbi:MAG: hypothetical protein IH861_00140 [Chloroflexi bacterium]|nr:hypothetical protein [Chloroflexota bacterium]
MSAKDTLDKLVDFLEENEADEAAKFVSYLIYLRDPVLRALREAPEDDEPETEEERTAMMEAYEDLKSGNIIPSDKILDEI